MRTHSHSKRTNGKFAHSSRISRHKLWLLKGIVNKKPTISVRSNFSIQHVSAIDVRKVVSRLPNKLSTGHDEMSYRLLKEAGPGLALPQTTMFNRCLELRQVPKEWKRAVVSPVFKGGQKDGALPSSYCPIALTSCVMSL